MRYDCIIYRDYDGKAKIGHVSRDRKAKSPRTVPPAPVVPFPGQDSLTIT